MFRSFARWCLAVLLTATACVGGRSSLKDAASGGKVIDAACGIPHRYLVRIARGYAPGRSGELQIIPRYPNFVAFSRPHSDPWDYLQEVPLFFYGPGHVPAHGKVEGRATMADVAPTLGAHLGFDFPTPDGRVLKEAVDPGGPAPKLVVVVVWDGGGRNVLRRYPHAWPVLRSLIPGGTWYEDAVVGSSPSVTPAVHATLGTGVFPRRHGLVDLRLRIEGEVVPVGGPWRLQVPTLAESYDKAAGNNAQVGLVAMDPWHLAMLGRGAAFPGGDRDLTALWSPESGRWQLDGRAASAYRLPGSVAQVGGLSMEVRALDAEDGRIDGTWLGRTPLEEPEDIEATPALTRWQTASLAKLLTGEGFGDDEIPDLLFTNYKQIDLVSHRWGMEDAQMRKALRASDEALGQLIDVLDREVGRGRWAMVLTADHGSTPPPSETGAFAIERNRFTSDIAAAFDGEGGIPVVAAGRVTQAWIDQDELRDRGHTLHELAAFVLGYTKEQNARDPAAFPAAGRGDALFAAAFPSAILEGVSPCLQPT